MADLSHIDKHGRARMVDVGDKPVTARKASATGIVTCQLLTLDLLKESKVPKGNVIGTAELAGVMAAKRTADLIPLCHQIPLSQVDVTITADDTLPGFAVAGNGANGGTDRCRNGSANGGIRRVPHIVRHAESGRQGYDDR